MEEPTEAIAEALLTAFRQMTGAPAADWSRAHRWRYAQVETPVGQPCLWDANARVGACGDWCLGGRIEAAFNSGVAMAAAVLG